MKYVASRVRPDRRVEYVAKGSPVPNIVWTLNFLTAATWDDTVTIDNYKREKKFPPEILATQLPEYDGKVCPYCSQVGLRSIGSARDIPQSEFYVECRSCGRQWVEVFKFETVKVTDVARLT